MKGLMYCGLNVLEALAKFFEGVGANVVDFARYVMYGFVRLVLDVGRGVSLDVGVVVVVLGLVLVVLGRVALVV